MLRPQPRGSDLPRDLGIKPLYYVQIASNERVFGGGKTDLIRAVGGTMGNRLERIGINGSSPSASEAQNGLSKIWPVLLASALVMSAGAVAARLTQGAGFDGALILGAAAVATVLALRLLAHDSHDFGAADERLKKSLDSAGSAVRAAGLDERLTRAGRSAVRTTGHQAEVLTQRWNTAKIPASGERSRLAAEIEAVSNPRESAATASANPLYRQQQVLLDAVADGICGVDPNGLVSFANPAAADLLGASAASLIGRPVHELLHGFAPSGSRCGEDCPLRRTSSIRAASTGEDSLFRADGSLFPVEYTLTPILDEGSFSGSVLSFRDISQRYALDRLKDEFISTVSHELRTPLTSIRGALGLLSSGILGEVNDKAENLLRIALTNSDRLVRLINDILDLERIQSGREPLAFRPVQLAEVVCQAIEGMQPVAEAAGVKLIHDATQGEIFADADRVLQVLTNLLSNAIKFSPPNSAVSIMMRPGVQGITISVIDNGRGIPADKLEAVFGRFQQVDASDSRQKGGSGLGLAICRTIVLQHSGRIWAERNPVRGSTFRVFLPFHPVPLNASGGLPADGAKHGADLLANASHEPRLTSPPN